MTEIILAFVTGLTTGGLSCLAVQGGLLASSLASQIERDLNEGQPGQGKIKLSVATPIVWFLLSKMIAYTLLGFLLGWMGSLFQLSPTLRAVLQICIGLFMLGQAGRLLKLHPVFRWFNIEPPLFIRKLIRKVSKNGDQILTPVFLGALTVLIPCGITQVMMVTAMASGNPLTGAALLFAFVLGTSPVFFVVAYFTTRIGARLEKYFTRFVALVVIVLGLVAINTGLNIAGFPYTVDRLAKQAFVQPVLAAGSGSEANTAAISPLLLRSIFPKNENPIGGNGTGCNCGMMGNRTNRVYAAPQSGLPSLPSETPADTSPRQSGNYTIEVLNTGYSPEVLVIPANQPVKVTFQSNGVFSCSLAIVIPRLNVDFTLPPTGTYAIEIPALQQGEQIPYSCSMGMFTGVIVVE